MASKNIFTQLAIIVGIFVVAYAGFWVWGWYQGKTAPSAEDTAVVEVDEAVAYFAGGCFWCTESDYEKLGGVKEATSGYMGGIEESPSYVDVSGGKTTHRESVKVVYDPQQVSYRQLVLNLFRHSDPTDSEGSFYDRGFQYTSAIFYQNEEEKRTAEEVISEVDSIGVFNSVIVTNIESAGVFWVAESYHQDFYKTNSTRYGIYRKGSGRDAFTDSVWGDGVEYNKLFKDETMTTNKWNDFQKPNEATLRDTLTSIQYHITQEEGTETPFQNEYWDNHKEGIYVDIISGEPLFSSIDKFDSGTGWPSFLKPIDYDFVTEHKDFKLIIPRTEIRSKYADSHLGHIILDGPIENDRIRYCMNSASMRFVPKEELESEGLGEYLNLFK